jgi:tetratricopeptide (TPR) repeat protein
MRNQLMTFALSAMYCGTAYAQTAATVRTEVPPGHGAVTVNVSDSSDAAFQVIATQYRAEKPKPPLPEEARKFRIQAEFAVQEKQFDRAVELYGKALAIAPWWPEGHFNRALILGQTRTYPDAIREMKRYLLLVPDAPDGRAAQDNIYQWEGVAEANTAAASEAAAKAMWTDANTGLVWQRVDDAVTRTQDDSIGYCRALSLGGFSDWRLPSRSELLSLWKDVGSQDTVRRTYFPDMKAQRYWSSAVNWAGGAWPVDFSNGSDWHFNKISTFYARCVRSGQ